MMGPEDDAPDPIGALLADELRRSSVAVELVEKHIDDNDEVLPTVLLGEIGDWFTDALSLGRSDEAEARRAVDVVAELYGDGDDEMRNAIASGFLEALPQPGDSDRAVVAELPRVLAEKLSRMESWVPPTR